MSNHQSYTVIPHDALKLKNLICMVTKPIISDQSPIIHKSSLIVMIVRKYIRKYLSCKLEKKNYLKRTGI